MDTFIVGVLIVGLVAMGGMTLSMARGDAAGREWLRRRWWVVAVIALGLAIALVGRLLS